MLSNFEYFYNNITNYIKYINPPSNIYVYNNTIDFILFNSTEKGIENYKSYCEKYNMAILNLNECFEELRKQYQSTEYLNFYVGLFNLKRSDTLTPQFDFIIYDQYGIKYKNEICNEIKVSKSFKDSSLVNDLYEKFKNKNINTLFYSKENEFYSDICCTYSNNSYDILLEDRYEMFHNNTNYKFCEDNCKVININISNYRVDCNCSNINSFNKYNLKDYGIYKEDKIIYDKNFQFMKCSKSLFKKDFEKNYGNYITLTFFFTQTINVIIFFLRGFKNFNSLLNKISIKKVNNNQINNDIPNDSNKNLQHININNPVNPPRKFKYVNKMNLESSDDDNKTIKNFNQNDIQSSSREISSSRKISSKNDNESNIYNRHYIYKIGNYINKYFNKLKRKNDSINNTNEENKESEKRKYYENEKDDLKNTISELEITNIKCSILFCKNIKKKHKLISLFNNNKYDISVYKFSLFILTLTLDLLFCCLFNSSSNISKLYQKQKKFTGKEVLIGFYSLLPSYFITKLIDCCMEYKNDLKYYINNKKI